MSNITIEDIRKIQTTRPTHIDVACSSEECEHFGVCEYIRTEVYKYHDGDVDILFVGQGGGKEEADEGLPFIGKAGKRLREIVIHIFADSSLFNVAFSNTTRNRPLDYYFRNRAPNEQELKSCLQYLKRDIKTLSPKLIVPLGLPASRALLSSIGSSSMVSIHGKIYTHDGLTYMPTYHPSYLIRNHAKWNYDEPGKWDLIVIDDVLKGLKHINIL